MNLIKLGQQLKNERRAGYLAKWEASASIMDGYLHPQD